MAKKSKKTLIPAPVPPRTEGGVAIATSRKEGKFWVDYGAGLIEVKQGAYRAALAELKTGMTRTQRTRLIGVTRDLILQQPTAEGLTRRQAALLAGALIDARGKLTAVRPNMHKLRDQLGDALYVIARTLY